MHYAINGHPLAGTYQDKVTNLNLFNGNLPLLALTDNQSGFWLHTDKLLYCF